jgi:hypothetical protein
MFFGNVAIVFEKKNVVYKKLFHEEKNTLSHPKKKKRIFFLLPTKF